MNKNITEQIKVVGNTLDALNKKDALTSEDIKKINNDLSTSLKDIGIKMDAFNKQVIDTEELQSEITKLKNELLNNITNKDKAVM